jgi:hypothetical protein
MTNFLTFHLCQFNLFHYTSQIRNLYFSTTEHHTWYTYIPVIITEYENTIRHETLHAKSSKPWNMYRAAEREMSPAQTARTAWTKLWRGNKRESRGHMLCSSGSEVGRGAGLAIDSDEHWLLTIPSTYFCCLLSHVHFIFSVGHPPRRPGFEPGSGQVGIVMDEVALGQVFSEYFGFPCPS